MSADGFIADEEGRIDWLDAYNSEALGAFFAAVGAVVLGRATYEYLLTRGTWPYPGRPALVVSSRPLPWLPDQARAVTVEGLGSALSALRGDTKGDIWIIGGGKTARACLELDMLGALELYVVPHLVGKGVPLFTSKPAPGPLRLIGTCNLPKGVVMLRYARGAGATRRNGPEMVP